MHIIKSMKNIPPDTRLANLLGAFACGLSDRLQQIAEDATNQTASIPAALVQIGSFADGSLSELQSSLASSQSNTTRIVQKMKSLGLADVVNSDSSDKRELKIVLTTDGQHLKKKVLSERQKQLTSLLTDMADEHKKILEDFLETALTILTPDRSSSDHTCRYCDIEACPQDICPAEPNTRCLNSI
jgi:MarR family transcriptional regulator, negative regulator of the multidrug operon emrRAB